jgi:ribosomal protein L10
MVEENKQDNNEDNSKKQVIEKELEKKKKQAIEKSHSSEHPIKAKAVNRLVDKMQHAKTIMVVNIKNLPSPQLQEIKKIIRDCAQVYVAKKNIIKRAIEKFGKDSILELENHISDNYGLAISEMEGYELAAILNEKKSLVNAKAGQISPSDIEIKAGPTDLAPGPAISELGSVGLQVAVEDGKISIKAPRVILKKGQVIDKNIASILQKLNIKPFSVGLVPEVIYDVESEKVYTEINIDPEKAKTDLSDAAGKALGFAQKIVYYCKETIGYLLAKANSEAESLNKLQPKEEKKEEVKEEKVEEAKPTQTEDSSSEKPITDTKKQTNTQLNNQEEK